MYEIIKAGENTYYIDCPSKMGLYDKGNGEAVAIDSGNGKDSAKKLIGAADSLGLKITTLINTHGHADHVGGNSTLQARTGCKILGTPIDVMICKDPMLLQATLCGCYPMENMRTKKLVPAASLMEELTAQNIPLGFEAVRLDGHAMNMQAVKTPDNVWFIGDVLLSKATMEKYGIGFLYNIEQSLESIDAVLNLSGEMFIPSHGEVLTKDGLEELCKLNMRQTDKITQVIKNICMRPANTDRVIKEVFDTYGMKMDFFQNSLIGATIRSYLTYMEDKGIIESFIEENMLLWRVKLN